MLRIEVNWGIIMKIKKFIAIALGIMQLFLMSQSAEAIRISFGITPSTLDELFLEQGDTEHLEFMISNDSVLPQGDLEDASIFTFDVFTNAFFDDETLDASKWIEFDI